MNQCAGALNKNEHGQVLTEALIALSVIIVPVALGVGSWQLMQFNRTECAKAAFAQARAELIKTQQPVQITVSCKRFSAQNHSSEEVRLYPLDIGGASQAQGVLEEMVISAWEEWF